MSKRFRQKDVRAALYDLLPENVYLGVLFSNNPTFKLCPTLIGIYGEGVEDFVNVRDLYIAWGQKVIVNEIMRDIIFQFCKQTVAKPRSANDFWLYDYYDFTAHGSQIEKNPSLEDMNRIIQRRILDKVLCDAPGFGAQWCDVYLYSKDALRPISSPP